LWWAYRGRWRWRLDPGVLLLAKPYRKSELARMIRQALAG
jgi:hypothetical protein